MSKALDLSLFVNQTLDITLPDGDVIKVKKPTEKGVMKLMALQQTDEEHAFEAMNDLVLFILNSNKEGKQFSQDWVDDNLDWSMKTAVIQAYSEFINELQSNPNS